MVCTDTDETLRQRVVHAISQLGHPELKRVAANVTGSKIRLQGKVPSYRLKQLVQSAARRIPGVRDVQDDLSVDYPGSRGKSLSSNGSSQGHGWRVGR